MYQGKVRTAFTETYNNSLPTTGPARAASPVSHLDVAYEDYAFDTEEDDDDDNGRVFPPPSPDPYLVPTLTTTTSTTAKLSTAAAAKASGAATKHAFALAALKAAYESQTPSHRWHLASSRTVETVLYESCLSMTPAAFLASLAPSFILDVSDTVMMEDLFTGTERKEIMSVVPEMPTADSKMVNSLVRFFQLKTTADVRQVLATTSFLDEGEIYERGKHFDACWADLVVRLMYIPPFHSISADPDQRTIDWASGSAPKIHYD